MTTRLHLVGAHPVGERWRAAGYIGGHTVYLGTFDREEDASQEFLRAKEAYDKKVEREASEEIDRIMTSPTYVYRGGIGRGAALNGKRFKIRQSYGPHQVVAVPLDGEGLPMFAQQAIYNRSYLYEEDNPNPEPITVPLRSNPADDLVRKLRGIMEVEARYHLLRTHIGEHPLLRVISGEAPESETLRVLTALLSPE